MFLKKENTKLFSDLQAQLINTIILYEIGVSRLALCFNQLKNVTHREH
jgi:hypothetical protein